jgi:hypothetical protein
MTFSQGNVDVTTVVEIPFSCGTSSSLSNPFARDMIARSSGIQQVIVGYAVDFLLMLAAMLSRELTRSCRSSWKVARCSLLRSSQFAINIAMRVFSRLAAKVRYEDSRCASTRFVLKALGERDCSTTVAATDVVVQISHKGVNRQAV